jgi:hypothetical protein
VFAHHQVKGADGFFGVFISSLLEQASLLQNSSDEILWRTILGVAIVNVTDPAADTYLRKSNFCHFVTHCCGNPAKRCAVIVIFITHAQNGDTIANAFIHQMFGAVTRRMRAVNITGLVMGAFMPVDKALKFSWRGGIIGSENNRFTTAIPDGHTSRHAGAPSAALNETNRFPFIVGTRLRINDIIRRWRLCILPHRDVGKDDAQCQSYSTKNATQCRAL